MPAILSRTSASCSAGRISLSAVSANAMASSLRPAICSAMAVNPTSSPRRGWWAGAISSARWPNCAAVSASVAIRASAASSSVATATSSPGSALAASCVATSMGSAPPSSNTPAACRSSARRADTGMLERTASRVMSCQKASLSSRSTSRSAAISSPTGARISDAGEPSVRASSSNENVRPSEAATVTTVLADSDNLPTRSRIPSCTRLGTASVHEFRPAALDTYPMLVAQSEQELHDQKRTAAGVVQERRMSRPPRHRAPHASALCMASASSGPSDTVVAPVRRSSSSALFTGVDPIAGRRAKTQAIGRPESRTGSVRSAAAVPLSAQCTSSIAIMIGAFERGPLQEALQVSQQPEPLPGLPPQAAEGFAIDQRAGRVGERRQQRCQLDHAFAGICRTGAHPHPQGSSDADHLGEQPALAHAGTALDDDHSGRPVTQLTERSP